MLLHNPSTLRWLAGDAMIQGAMVEWALFPRPVPLWGLSEG
jgi:hypothetical protein